MIARMLRAFGYRKTTQPDARVPVLAQELLFASHALAKASDAMKRNLTSPDLTKRTRAAATRAEGVLEQLGLVEQPANGHVRK